ncbi:LamG domain-containing protein [bacterium]|nr:LamG domain-containing protein [bacterium]
MLTRLLCFALFMSLLLVTAASIRAQEFVTDGLVAFWTLDKADIDGAKVKDVSGNGNDAKIVGKLNSVKGQIDECLKFDGVAGNYVEIPDMGEFKQVSVDCWALGEQIGASQGIVSTWQWVAGKVHFKFEGNEIQVDKNGAGKIRFAATQEQWYHIIYTTDTPTALKLYVDGELVANGPGGAEPENWHERRIGSEHDGRFLMGMVDEVRVYERVLSEKEVEQNFKVESNEMAVSLKDKLATRWGHLKEITRSQ